MFRERSPVTLAVLVDVIDKNFIFFRSPWPFLQPLFVTARRSSHLHKIQREKSAQRGMNVFPATASKIVDAQYSIFQVESAFNSIDSVEWNEQDNPAQNPCHPKNRGEIEKSNRDGSQRGELNVLIRCVCEKNELGFGYLGKSETERERV